MICQDGMESCVRLQSLYMHVIIVLFISRKKQISVLFHGKGQLPSMNEPIKKGSIQRLLPFHDNTLFGYLHFPNFITTK